MCLLYIQWNPIKGNKKDISFFTILFNSQYTHLLFRVVYIILNLFLNELDVEKSKLLQSTILTFTGLNNFLKNCKSNAYPNLK